MQFKFTKLKKDVIGIKEPEIAGDAGYDLYSCEDAIIEPMSTKLIHTGIAIQLPPGYWFEIMPKSGIATKNNVFVHNGVIDYGYRGEIMVFMYNFNHKPYEVKKNHKIAQGVIRQHIVFELAEVESLNKTDRGDKGFGSTGLK